MTTTWHEAVVCECGHRGTVHWSENDQPFSKQWEEYSIEGFKGGTYFTDGMASLDEAIKHMAPVCPICGAVGKIEHV